MKSVSIEAEQPHVLIRALLDKLRVLDPAAYQQIVFAPFSTPPAYALDDDSSEWWGGSECVSFMEELRELVGSAGEAGEV